MQHSCPACGSSKAWFQYDARLKCRNCTKIYWGFSREKVTNKDFLSVYCEKTDALARALSDLGGLLARAKALVGVDTKEQLGDVRQVQRWLRAKPRRLQDYYATTRKWDRANRPGMRARKRAERSHAAKGGKG